MGTKWIKRGVIFNVENNSDWMMSHASNPVAQPLGGGLVRVYFSSRDKSNRSSIGYFEFDISPPYRVLRLGKNALVSPGELGLFDDSGASMGCCVSWDGLEYLYYTGWNLGGTVPWHNSIGLAIRDTAEFVFKKYTRAPIVDRNATDPFSLSYPWVMRDDSGWKMWYGSNLSWGTQAHTMQHVIKYAESADGIHWQRQGMIAIPLQSPNEWGISKPCVISEEGIYRMWYSVRGEKYRIGYAESKDGIHWDRRDDLAGITASPSGWDSEMIEYPCVFDQGQKRYMLYNGNSFGKTGIGLAELFDR